MQAIDDETILLERQKTQALSILRALSTWVESGGTVSFERGLRETVRLKRSTTEVICMGSTLTDACAQAATVILSGGKLL